MKQLDLQQKLEQAEAERDALQQQVNALAAENTGMDKFVNECLQVAWEAGSLDGADIQEMALKNGLLRKEPYCADLHENMTDDPGNFDEGDEFFIRVDAPETDAIKRQWMAEGLEWMSKKAGPEFPKTQVMCEHFAAQLRQPEERVDE